MLLLLVLLLTHTSWLVHVRSCSLFLYYSLFNFNFSFFLSETHSDSVWINRPKQMYNFPKTSCTCMVDGWWLMVADRNFFSLGRLTVGQFVSVQGIYAMQLRFTSPFLCPPQVLQGNLFQFWQKCEKINASLFNYFKCTINYTSRYCK